MGYRAKILLTAILLAALPLGWIACSGTSVSVNNPVTTTYRYAGTKNTVAGGEIWRSTDGTSWVRLAGTGFGNAANTQVFPYFLLDGYVYAATANAATGMEIWRSDDDWNWVGVVAAGAGVGSGFGDANNKSPSSRTPSVFGSYLYVGTTNTVTGGELWRTSDGIAWAQTNTNGFGDANNKSIPAMAVFSGKLYCGTMDGQIICLDARTGKPQWQAKVGGRILFEPAVVGGAVYAATEDSMVIRLETGDKTADGWAMWGGSAKHNGSEK